MQKAYCVGHLIEIYPVDIALSTFRTMRPNVSRLLSAKGSFGNDDCDGNENVIKAIDLLILLNLHVHHAFSSISLPSLHYYDVKIPNFTFYGGCKQATKKPTRGHSPTFGIFSNL